MARQTPPRPFLERAALAFAAVALVLFPCTTTSTRTHASDSTPPAAPRADRSGDGDDPLAPSQVDPARPGEALPAQRPARAPVESRHPTPGTPLRSASGAHASALPSWLPRLGSAPGFAQPSLRVLFCTWLT
jgi:hypothetical protein